MEKQEAENDRMTAGGARMSRRAGQGAGAGHAPRLYQRACKILADQIRSGAIPADTILLESGVAAQFGISRAPARQALSELERLGLIEKAAGRGYRVRRPRARGKPRAKATGNPADHGLRLLPRSSWEGIYAEVEGEIVARTSFAGWRVNEAELARSYRVSRTVARDVVARLHQRGIVRKDESARWYAPALTPGHVGELYELRALLEPVALMKAAPNLPTAHFSQMRASLDAAISEPRDIGGPTLDRLEEELHVTLLGHCRNRALMQAISVPQSLLVAHRFLYRWTSRLFDIEPFLAEHLAIVRQLERGRISQAAKLLADHLTVSRERAIARIDVIVSEFRAEDLPYLERLGSD